MCKDYSSNPLRTPRCLGPTIPLRQSFSDSKATTDLPALNTQIGGSHYKDMAIQPMTYSMANGLDACQHTIIKYVSRFRHKNGIEDLEKAKHCLDLLIEFEQKRRGNDQGLPDRLP